jgi:RNA polymerase sigma factor (sigma-70 family)
MRESAVSAIRRRLNSRDVFNAGQPLLRSKVWRMEDPAIKLLSSERAQWLAANILPLEPLVRAWLWRVTPAGLEPDDVIQEAYTKIACLESTAHIIQPKPYFFRVVKSLILEYLRHSQVVAIESVAEVTELPISREEASPERIVSGRQQLERLFHLIEELPAGCREVFKLRKFEDLSQREIATRLRISENTVEKQLARALRLLLMRFAEDQDPATTESDVRQHLRKSEYHGEP